MVTGGLVNRFSNFCVLVSCFSKFSFLQGMPTAIKECREFPADGVCTEDQLSDLMVVLEGVKGLVLRVAYSPAGTTLTFSIVNLVWDG